MCYFALVPHLQLERARMQWSTSRVGVSLAETAASLVFTWMQVLGVNAWTSTMNDVFDPTNMISI